MKFVIVIIAAFDGCRQIGPRNIAVKSEMAKGQNQCPAAERLAASQNSAWHQLN
jgi:hypothetical protein